MKIEDTFVIKSIDRLMIALKLDEKAVKILENRTRDELFKGCYLCNEFGVGYTIYGTEWHCISRKPGVGDVVALAVDSGAVFENGEEVHIATSDDVWVLKGKKR